MSEIQRIEVFSNELTYAHGDYVMSGGRTIRTLQSSVVRITTESGVEGFGEVCPLGPNYLPGYGNGAPSVIAEFAHTRSSRRFRGHVESTGQFPHRHRPSR